MATDKLVDFDHVTDCISREAAGNGIYSCPTKTDADGYIWVRTKDVAHMIDEIPAADVRPVVRGKWKNVHPSSPMLDAGGPPYCSVCGKAVPLRPVVKNQWKLERGHISGPEVVYSTENFFSNFCPNCGADMMEETVVNGKGN